VTRTRRAAALLVLAALSIALAAGGPSGGGTQQPDAHLGPPRAIAPGVELFHLTDPALLAPAAPVSIWILRLDPARADLRAALANDMVVDTETVGSIAARHGAVAAVNAGFFLPNGDPSGLYKLDGRLISDTRRPRGAVGILRSGAGPELIFGRVSATVTLRILRRARVDARVTIAGVDTTRLLGRPMVFTPAYAPDTGTAAGGAEWVVDGTPPRVIGAVRTQGRTPIPKDGWVLSYGGPRPPQPLASLRSGTRVELEPRYAPSDGPPERWERAHDIVGGAGLLVRDGEPVTDWSVEALAGSFVAMRHPRTMIGVRPDGSIWLVTVDGRQPQLSAGMTLEELRDLAGRLRLRDALNLDGGGSTTMWAGGEVLNSPSDAAGPRKVSDALLVMPR
jgi:hypothetical protein